jgi:glyoxylase-like metal-dependent hydrolase (beta-lactamase superfamily II)
MAQKPMNVRFFQSGYCTSHSKVIDPRTAFTKIQFAAIWALIDLPSGGYAMVDTGYSNHFLTATKPFPDRIYRWVTPMFLKTEETPLNILQQAGISPNQIHWIVISHFHADHIAGLKDFPQAKFICSNLGLEEARKYRGLSAVKRGILHGLIPEDFWHRIHTFEEEAQRQYIDEFGLTRFEWAETPGINWALLPGHARGMLGFEYSNNNRTIFYATDAAWSYAAFKDWTLPLPVVKIFIDSMSDMKQTWSALHAWLKENPEGKIYFTHCPKTLSLLSHE